MTVNDKNTAILDKVKFQMAKFLKLKGYGISILVPFHSSDPNNQRAKNWKWLCEYWKKQLPGAEIIVGVDSIAGNGIPFSKSCAVNDAARRATGDIFVIVDADGYISIESVLHCATEIRAARRKNKKLWFIPYRKFYRLTEAASQKVLQSNPEKPYCFGLTPAERDVLNISDFNGTSGCAIGHWYGALIQIMSSDAFNTVGGWDPRFRGWGGEDHAAMRAMDTLYWPHKTLPKPVYHIWHPFLNVQSSNPTRNKNRLWENQNANITNDSLSHRYYWSQGNIERMQKLIDEWKRLNETKTNV